VTQPTRYELAAWILAGLALVGVLHLGLLAALLAGLLVFELVDIAAAKLATLGVSRVNAKIAALAVVAVVTIAAVTLAMLGLFTMLVGRSESVEVLLRKMADVIDTASMHYPAWTRTYLPANADELDAMASTWLRSHAGDLQAAGTSFGRTLLHIFIGMIVGGIAVIGKVTPDRPLGPLARSLADRGVHLGTAFRRVVFAQVRISALNTTLTAIYLVGVLPLTGIHLPLTKTMIALTFIVGLLPVVGNLISNTVIVVVSLSASVYAALGSLLFLILIHKLEYFVNARIIGHRIKARAWELLVAMLVMDAAFGIPGVIAAPIYYAYLKDELASRHLI
jgi:predicted PurR-regulated permease PerM